mgnify:CR=1 FL=1
MRIYLHILIAIFFAGGISEAQIKQRTQNRVFYTGVGYKFVLFTDSEARSAYPFFDITDQAFVKELGGFFGMVLSERVAFELAPSYIFSNEYGSDDSEADGGGFYFKESGVERYYVPSDAKMFAIPVNARIKYFPFAKDYSSAFNLLYFGAGAGPIYISEEMTQRVYTDEGRLDYLGVGQYADDFWTVNFEAIAGIATVPKFGIGFEMSYRFIPLGSADGTKPLITSIAKNFNSFNIAANVIYKF